MTATTVERPPASGPPAPQSARRVSGGFLNPKQLLASTPDALRKLNPATLWRNPRHPYTRALLASIPSAKPGQKPAAVLAGEVGQGMPERGCRFRARCPVAVKQCETDDPALRKLPDGNAVACHLA